MCFKPDLCRVSDIAAGRAYDGDDSGSMRHAGDVSQLDGGALVLTYVCIDGVCLPPGFFYDVH